MSTNLHYRPGGELISQHIDFFILCDCSGSMNKATIHSLNTAIYQTCIAIRNKTAPFDTSTTMSIARFATTADWHIRHANINKMPHPSLSAGQGITSLGAAYQLLREELETLQAGKRNTIIILISDGKPTDNEAVAINQLLQLPLANNAQRFAIGIEPEADTEVLLRFATVNSHILYTSSTTELQNQLKAFCLQGIQKILQR